MVHVASEMERQGINLPLLIGGATTSKPAHRGQDRPGVLGHHHARPRRVASGRRRLQPARPRGPAGASTRATARSRSACARYTPARPGRPCCPTPPPSPTARRSPGGRRTWPCRSSPVPGSCETGARGDRAVHRLDLLLLRLGAAGQVPRGARPPGVRPGGPGALRQRPGPARADRARAPPGGPGGLRPLAGRGRRRRHRALRRRRARRRARSASPCCASSARRPRARPTTASPTTWRRPARAWPTTSGAFAVTTGLGADDLAGVFEARARRLQRDHGEGAGRPPGRGVRRDAPRARPPRLGLRPGRDAERRRPGRRALPRHPPGLRLPGLPGPHARSGRSSTCSTRSPSA